ncbi:sialate O-acetylesterase [Halovulum sp. GXIMD14794]
MRFGPGLGITAAPALGRRRTAAGRVVPAGVIPEAQARLDDHAGWMLDGGFTALPGAVAKTGHAAAGTVAFDAALPSGDVWVAYTVTGATAGTVGAELGGPFRSAPFVSRAAGQQVARFSSAGHTRVRLKADASFDGTIEDVQAVDMSALLAQPSDIYIAAGQSLIAAESKSTPIDPDKDYWLPRCLYMPGYSSNAYGSVDGVVAACAGPLQMLQASQGVSPALSFARTIEGATPPGRTVLIVACAKGGTRLVGNDAEWNPAGDTGAGGTLYSRMVQMAQAAAARVPGSRVRGLLWGQGESDRAATMGSSYPPAFQAMLSSLRGDLGEPDLPVVLLGPMPDDTNPHQGIFLQMQAALDQDSGQPTATPGVHYVARPAGHLSDDGTHPEPEGNRIAGRLAAERFIAEGYL